MVAANQPGLVNITIEPRGAVHLGGKVAEIYWFGRGHTDGDVVVLFPQHRTLAAGDLFTAGEGLPQLVDHAGGGSAKEWTATLDKVLALDFETVVPGHGNVTNKQALREYRGTSQRMTEVLTQMVRQNRSAADIEAVLRNEFGFQDFHIQGRSRGSTRCAERVESEECRDRAERLSLHGEDSARETSIVARSRRAGARRRGPRATASFAGGAPAATGPSTTTIRRRRSSSACAGTSARTARSATWAGRTTTRTPRST